MLFDLLEQFVVLERTGDVAGLDQFVDEGLEFVLGQLEDVDQGGVARPLECLDDVGGQSIGAQNLVGSEPFELGEEESDVIVFRSKVAEGRLDFLGRGGFDGGHGHSGSLMWCAVGQVYVF